MKCKGHSLDFMEHNHHQVSQHLYQHHLPHLLMKRRILTSTILLHVATLATFPTDLGISLLRLPTGFRSGLRSKSLLVVGSLLCPSRGPAMISIQCSTRCCCWLRLHQSLLCVVRQQKFQVIRNSLHIFVGISVHQYLFQGLIGRRQRIED